MSKIDKSLLLVAAAVFEAKGNEELNAVGVTPNGQAFANLEAAKRFAAKHKQAGECHLITRADVEAGLAEKGPVTEGEAKGKAKADKKGKAEAPAQDEVPAAEDETK